MRFRTSLALVIGGGVVIRVVLAFSTNGLVFDLHSYSLVDQALRSHPLHVYALLNTPSLYRWPYPAGFFPVVLLTHVITAVTGLAFTSLIRLPAILGDAALAWVVQDFLRLRGASERMRLAAAATVALGPLFIAVSGYNGQIDSLAILPGVGALALWDRLRGDRRALICGALIGVGAALKSFPLLMVLPLLGACRSRREAAVLVGAAVAVPAIAMAPFLIRDSHNAIKALRYHSLSGLGGLSLLVQPDLAGVWLGGPFHHLSGLSDTLQGTVGALIAAGALGCAALVMVRFRPGATEGAVLLWLTFFALSVNFGPRYAIWGLPFFLMGGHVVGTVALQAILIGPEVLLLAGPFRDHDVVPVYVVLMVLAWAGCLAATGILLRRIVHSGRSRLPPALAGAAAHRSSVR